MGVSDGCEPAARGARSLARASGIADGAGATSDVRGLSTTTAVDPVLDSSSMSQVVVPASGRRVAATSSKAVTSTSRASMRARTSSPASVSTPLSVSRASTTRMLHETSPSESPTLPSIDTTCTGPESLRAAPMPAPSNADSSTSESTPLARSQPQRTTSSRSSRKSASGKESPRRRRMSRWRAWVVDTFTAPVPRPGSRGARRAWGRARWGNGRCGRGRRRRPSPCRPARTRRRARSGSAG